MERMKGYEQGRFLVMKEVSFSFNLMRKKPKFGKRLVHAFRYLLNKDIPLQFHDFTFSPVPDLSLHESNFITVSVKFSREKDGTFTQELNPPVNQAVG